MKKSSQQIWFYVDRDGKTKMSLDEPKKNEKIGKYEAKYPYVNCLIYKEICEVVKHACLTYESEPQFIEIQLELQ